MEFKDVWKPRIDGVDDANSSAVNEIAEAVIENEDAIKKNANNISKKQDKLTDEQLQNIEDVSSKQNALSEEQLKNIQDVPNKADTEYVNKTFTNILKGTASGEAIGLHDVSPIEHTMKVKVRSENPDVSVAKVNKYGANLFNVAEVLERTNNGLVTSITEDGGISITGVATATTRYFADGGGFKNQILLPVGTYTLSGHGLLTCVVTYLDGTGTWKKGTFTLDKPAYFKNIILSGLTVDTEYNMTVYPCLSVGDNAEYEPYKEPTTYTPNADGTVEGVTSLFPATTLMTDTQRVTLDVEYNRDINKAFEELTQAILVLGGGI